MMSLGLVLIACIAASAVSAQASPSPPPFPWWNASLPTATRVNALIEAMNASEKASQLITDFAKAAVAIPHLAVPSYDWRSNVLHGLVDNGVSTVFPQAIGMAATWNTPLLAQMGQVVSDEQRAKFNQATANGSLDVPMNYGLNIWGPNINLFVKPLWGRGQETYGEDPFLTGVLAASFIGGLQGDQDAPSAYWKTAATAKHFAGYNVDRMPPRLSYDPNVTDTDLRQTYFPAFEASVRGGVHSIMCSYNGLNGYPMCASPMLQTVLREELGFDGFVCSDSGAIDFFVTYQNFSSNSTIAAAVALRAGVDLNSGSAYYSLPAALEQGYITEAELDQAARRLFTARIRLGLFDPPESVPYSRLGPAVIASPAHLALAHRVARESIVLLKNDGLLPLDPARVRRIAIVGPNANSTLTLAGNYYGCTFKSGSGPLLDNCTFVTPLAGIQQAAKAGGVAVDYVQGADVESNDTSGFAPAIAAAQHADVVIAVLGLTNCVQRESTPYANCESEGHDRTNITLPGVQQALLDVLRKSGTPVAVVLVNGGPVALSTASLQGADGDGNDKEGNAAVGAVLETWYGGQLAGTALGDVLFGNYSPSGRLPFTVPASDAQVPDYLNMSMAAAPGRTYRYLEEEPQFAFGFGLSYTTFAYGNMSVTPDTAAAGAELSVAVCVDVRNTGTRAGAEVVQVYATYNVAARFAGAAAVPLCQLVAFSKTDELAPNTEEHVCLTVAGRDLRLMSADGNFGVQSGNYTLTVGGSAPGSRGQGLGPDPALLTHSLLLQPAAGV